MLDKFTDFLGYRKKRLKREYNQIEYNEPGDPKENSKNLIEAVAIGNEWIQTRTKEDYEFIGVFFSVVLLIEYKLNDLLKGFWPNIENEMFGQKIEVYKDFLKIYVPHEGEDIQEYRNIIAPLKVIKRLRDAMAHDISKSKIAYDDVKELEGYLKSRRQDLFEAVSFSQEDEGKVMGIISGVGFILSCSIADIRHQVI